MTILALARQPWTLGQLSIVGYRLRAGHSLEAIARDYDRTVGEIDLVAWRLLGRRPEEFLNLNWSRF